MEDDRKGARKAGGLCFGRYMVINADFERVRFSRESRVESREIKKAKIALIVGNVLSIQITKARF